MLICPRCTHGYVLKVQLIERGEVLFLCDECEATWLSRDAIGSEPWVDFTTYTEGKGLPPLWDGLKILTKDL